jgi:hypothetical protein
MLLWCFLPALSRKRFHRNLNYKLITEIRFTFLRGERKDLINISSYNIMYGQLKQELSYIRQNEGRLTGLVTSCVGTAPYSTLLKET